jgi:hypothetical protein
MAWIGPAFAFDGHECYDLRMLPTRSQLQAAAALTGLVLVGGYILWFGWAFVVDFFTFPLHAVPPERPMTFRQMASFFGKAMIFFMLLTTALSLPVAVLCGWLNHKGTPLGPIVRQAKVDTMKMLDTRARRERAMEQANELENSTQQAQGTGRKRRL